MAVWESRLRDFNRSIRLQALGELSAALRDGRIAIDAESDVVNMHCHTFFSFNAYGHSPTSLAWLAKRGGFKVMGIVDFDVLDGVEEFLSACEILEVRGSAGLETRVFLPEFSTREINSPGEPGVYYSMGIGFTSSVASDDAAERLSDLRRQSEKRNRAMLERLNAHMDPVTVDYAKDVQSLTPAGNATERHILQAYIQAVKNRWADGAAFWSEKLNLAPEIVSESISNEAAFQNLVRSKLMKRGGVGYIQPGPETFPLLDTFHQLVAACGAVPCATWLDGTSAGEQAMEELLDLLIAKGAVALNIIPDRNWNIQDEDIRKRKIRNLYWVVELAQALDLPLNVGTEMNSNGQKLVDDFDSPALAPLREAFLAGAYFIYGHTQMQRALQLGYQSEWAKTFLPRRRERNAFYEQVGRAVPPGRNGAIRWRQLNGELSPAEILDRIAHPS
jgi:hypothetical protein